MGGITEDLIFAKRKMDELQAEMDNVKLHLYEKMKLKNTFDII